MTLTDESLAAVRERAADLVAHDGGHLNVFCAAMVLHMFANLDALTADRAALLAVARAIHFALHPRRRSDDADLAYHAVRAALAALPEPLRALVEQAPGEGT